MKGNLVLCSHQQDENQTLNTNSIFQPRPVGVNTSAARQQLPRAAAEPPPQQSLPPVAWTENVKLQSNKINVRKRGRRQEREGGRAGEGERDRASEWAAVAIFPIFTLLHRVQLLGPLRSNQTSGDGRKILPLSHKVLFEKEYLLFGRICSHFIWIHLFFKVKEEGGGVGEDKGGGRRGTWKKKNNQQTNKPTTAAGVGGCGGCEGGENKKGEAVYWTERVCASYCAWCNVGQCSAQRQIRHSEQVLCVLTSKYLSK